jgi:uncharacterized protein
MIRELSIENCYSFLQPTTFSLQVSQKAPHSRDYLRSIVAGDRIAKVVAIMGPNASGKSNLLRVISFLKWYLLDSYGKNGAESVMPLHPFLLTEKPFAPTRIEIEFENDRAVYRFKVTLSDSVVLSEELSVLDLTITRERNRFKQLFSRVLSNSGEDYQIKSHPEFKLNEGIIEIVKTRKNASLVSAAILSNHEPSKPLRDYWSKVSTKIKQLGESELDHWESSEFYHKNQHFKRSLEKVMSLCDLGLVGMDIEKIEVPQLSPSESKQEYFMPYGRHPGLAGKEYRLPFLLESAGTQQVFNLLATLLPVLESGGIAVIDEIESDKHPDLLPVLLELFSSEVTNPRGAQLIFTTHATPLLFTIDKYQVLLVEKDSFGVSRATRLDQLAGVRSDDNLFAKYTAGLYGARHKIQKKDGLRF